MSPNPALEPARTGAGNRRMFTSKFANFDGGGRNGVKHGDLDESLYFPGRALDVHMGGKHNMQCSDCDHEEKNGMLWRTRAVTEEEES